MPDSAYEFDVAFDQVGLKGYDLIGLSENDVCCDASYSALRINLYWLAEGFNPEEYWIIAGMYDFTTGQRLNMPNNPAKEIVLATIKAP